MAFGFDFAPKGWMPCHGQVLEIAKYPELYSLLGITYGGNAKDTFALPDLRGRSLIGSGQGPNLEGYEIGLTGGAETVRLSLRHMPAHGHAISCSSGDGNIPTPVGAFPAANGAYQAAQNAHMSAFMVGHVGGDEPHENRSPFIAVNWCICVEGVLPSRDTETP